MAGSDTNGALTLQLANLHGDIVATQANQAGSTTIDTYTESDEYGNALSTTTTGRYGWLGSYQRSTDAVGGMVLMGARLYNGATGLFTSPDPVPGGNANPYTYPLDPMDSYDLDGHLRVTRERHWWGAGVTFYFHQAGTKWITEHSSVNALLLAGLPAAMARLRWIVKRAALWLGVALEFVYATIVDRANQAVSNDRCLKIYIHSAWAGPSWYRTGTWSCRN